MTNIRNGRTALVVDDEQTLLDLLETELVEAGFETTCFTHGQPALAALQERHFDLLVVDVGLPDTNGMQICEVARQHYGDKITIFIITGDNRRSRCVTALELGADDFVGKPFDMEELLARIDVKLRRTMSVE